MPGAPVPVPWHPRLRAIAMAQAPWLLLVVAFHATGHSGGLDKQGCHTNRKTGDYHCHRGSPARPASREPEPASQRFAPAPAAPATLPRTRAFTNCAEARAAGAAPVRRGDPGYGPHLDRDNDGIGCEPYRGR